MADTIKTVLIDGGPPIALSDEEARFIYNLLPVGKFYDKRYGQIDVSPEKIRRMAENFGKYPSYEVPVKLGHEQGAKSPGKVISVDAKPAGLEITMLVDAETAQAINAKQYRYMSAEFDENYHDKVTGEDVGSVLLGAALVNQPANPYMEPLKLAEEIGITDVPNSAQREKEEKSGLPLKSAGVQNEGGREGMNEVEELRIKLSDTQAQVQELQNATADRSKEAEETAKKLAELEAENKKLKEERAEAEAAKNEAEVKSFCDKWASKGIPPVMLDKVKPLLLGESSRVIKLSDAPRDEINSLKFFDELFDGLPKIPMGQISSSEAPAIELSDIERAREHARSIAASVGSYEKEEKK
ncbi:MAG: hypothetical protein IJU48_02710 [Synergistaceae bacterium]|nr:hypothetical protein [Synergistaceae bacterium]